MALNDVGLHAPDTAARGNTRRAAAAAAGRRASTALAGAAPVAHLAQAGLHLRERGDGQAGRLEALWALLPAGATATVTAAAALLARPEIAAPALRGRLAALANILHLALRSDSALALSMLEEILPASRAHGNSDAAPLAYMALAVYGARQPGRAGAALALARGALALAARSGLDQYAGATQLLAGSLLLPWLRPLPETHVALASARDSALARGDGVLATRARTALYDLALWRGTPLAELQQQLEPARPPHAAGNGGDSLAWASRQRLLRALRGAAPDAATAEPEEPRHALLRHYFAGNYTAALQASARIAAVPADHGADRFATPTLCDAAHAWYTGLAHAAAHAGAGDATAAAAHLQALGRHRRALADLAQHCPATFAAMETLLRAEIARLEQQPALAMPAYEQAITAAAALQQWQVLALAHELAGGLYAQLGLHTAAGAHLQQARQAYLRWGALHKVRQLEARLAAATAGGAALLAAAAPAPGAQASAAAAAPPVPAAEAPPAARISAMGHFAASIAHEVNQPLAAMVLNAGAGLNWLKREPPDLDQVRASLHTIIAAGTRAADIIRSMRRLAQRAAPELAPVQVDDTIADVLALLRGEFQQHDIVVDTQLALGRLRIRADRGQLQQVMMNLLINAIDAMAGVTGRARVLNVASRLEPDGATLRISVEDSGVGLTPEQVPRIFDALVSSKPAGMGMGLAICRAIVDAHGGSIWCHAGAPHGAAFHISLPAPPR